MSEQKCLSETELLSFADADLSPEKLKRVEKHLELCSSCAKQVMALHALIEDIGAPVEPARFDVSSHVAAVMRRLDAPAEPARRSHLFAWGGALVAAAAVGLFLVAHERAGGLEAGLTARGAPLEKSLSREVGVQLYARGESLRPLQSGDPIRTNSALTAGLRNLSDAPAHLLLFAVDSQGVVHWIAPEFTVPGSNPQATVVATSASERLLPSTVVFDDLVPGPLRVVALIAREPMRVMDVDTLPRAELESERLMKRFPRAEVRLFQLEVLP